MSESVHALNPAELGSKPDIKDPKRFKVLRQAAAKAIFGTEQITGVPLIPSSYKNEHGTYPASHNVAKMRKDPGERDAAAAQADQDLKAKAQVVQAAIPQPKPFDPRLH